MADIVERITYQLRINGGEPIPFETTEGRYQIAALQAFGRLDMPYPCEVEICIPHLVEAGYGPYRYIINDFVDMHGNRYGCPAVMIAALRD